ITLRGRVLKIGGLKEKLVAAHRAGVESVLIPEANEKDLEKVPGRVRRSLEIVPVEHMDDVLVNALALEDRETFAEQLRKPSLPPEVLRGDVDGEAEDEEGLDQTTSPSAGRKLH
ncbi:MAG: S16 family serine protease, partial [Bradymonadaceae bacterium]